MIEGRVNSAKSLYEIMNSLVSIIVRTKDRPKLLKNALRSIAAQTYRPIEVVLVNDGGCDLDIEEIKSILRDVSLNYIRLEKNTGRAHAGNVGIENTNGKYIGFLDDDDEYYPEHLAVFVSLLNQVDYKIVYADSEFKFIEFDFGTREISEIEKRTFSSKEFSYEELLFGNYIPLISILFSREVLVSVGSFDESFDLYEDWDLLIRCGHRYPFYHIKKITSKYVQWSKELQIAQSEKFLREVDSAFDKVISKHRDKFTPNVVRYLLKFRDGSQELNNIIRAKDAVISEKDAYIKKLEKTLKEKDDYIYMIHSGRGWRLLTRYFKIRDWFFRLIR